MKTAVLQVAEMSRGKPGSCGSELARECDLSVTYVLSGTLHSPVNHRSSRTKTATSSSRRLSIPDARPVQAHLALP